MATLHILLYDLGYTTLFTYCMAYNNRKKSVWCDIVSIQPPSYLKFADIYTNNNNNRNTRF